MLKVIALLKRKPGLSMEDFMHYYETRHAPLMTRLQQPEMIGYRRNFVQVDGGIFSDGERPWFDVITELYFPTAPLMKPAWRAMPNLNRRACGSRTRPISSTSRRFTSSSSRKLRRNWAEARAAG